ncbi:UNVERIFIED_CONTAM: putative alpha,alpha-trehalose-phosphate synthase [UDP-forming] 10 [Sesamum radiatum]|uniref:Alpha,alpha-trehalose-phosphate synthase [UDP-forming] 10 n=1 Tax=Sesamum radiatum TaxID=300843 RepID=A0AAW2TUQ0_SESRA
MFESISSAVSGSPLPASPEIFACTVGQKPSKAKYYLDDTVDVMRLLRGLANASNPKPWDSADFQDVETGKCGTFWGLAKFLRCLLVSFSVESICWAKGVVLRTLMAALSGTIYFV